MGSGNTELDKTVLFAKNFVRHPRMLGSIIPSSRFLTRRLLGRVNFDRARVLVEYGPGVGTFTREILRRMRPDATLLAFETNAEFVGFLRSTIRDERLRVIEGSALHVSEVLRAHGHDRADYVISGIPFTMLPIAEGNRILEATRAALHPEGAFLLFQFSPQLHDRLARRFRHVRRVFEPLNVPPAYVFDCR